MYEICHQTLKYKTIKSFLGVTRTMLEPLPFFHRQLLFTRVLQLETSLENAYMSRNHKQLSEIGQHTDSLAVEVLNYLDQVAPSSHSEAMHA